MAYVQGCRICGFPGLSMTCDICTKIIVNNHFSKKEMTDEEIKEKTRKARIAQNEQAAKEYAERLLSKCPCCDK